MKTAKIEFETFCAIIADLCKKHPFEFEGREWLAVDQESLAHDLGISVSTLKRYIKKPPVVRKWTTDEDRQYRVLLRIGEPDPLTAREIGNSMAAWYRKETGHKPTPDEAGCLIGLASVWPEGEQHNIFKHAVKNWPGYMSYVDCFIIDQNAATGKEDLVKRFFDYVSLTVLRRFPEPALTLYHDHLQKAALSVPASIRARFPDIYPS